MTYVQNTEQNQADMLAAIGMASTDELWKVIPEDCLFDGSLDVGPALTEDSLVRHMREIAKRNVTANDNCVCPQHDSICV